MEDDKNFDETTSISDSCCDATPELTDELDATVVGEADASTEKTEIVAPGDNDLDREIRDLARLSVWDYEKVRVGRSKELGIRAPILDRLVKQARTDSEPSRGRSVELYSPEPWPEPVNGSAVLDQAYAAIRRHMVISEHHAIAAVLWAAHVHAFDVYTHTPRLLIDSPAPECAKTLLMCHLVGNMIPRPMPVEIMKAAPFFRLTEQYQPVWLIDELDAFLKEDSDLLAAVNGGWEPHGGVPRCVGDGGNMEVRFFSTWTPVAMAGINARKLLPESTVGRSIVIELERAAPGEIDPDDIYDARNHREHLLKIGRKLARWTQDNLEQIAQTRPELPPGVRNRLADRWTPLFIIAAIAGGHWPARAQNALLAEETPSQRSLSLQLLADIRDVLRPDEETIWTEHLIDRLSSLEDARWASYNRNQRDDDKRRIQPRQVSNLLHDFKCKPKDIRNGTQCRKGYERGPLVRAWERYLPDVSAESATPRQFSNGKASRSSAAATQAQPVAETDRLETMESAACSGVADSVPPKWEKPWFRIVPDLEVF